jgi:lipopolysaccharide export system ATP-binding protein
MLEIKKISKSIKEKKIVSNISFEVKAGDIFGLLGPNGAGKTTTFYMIAGLVHADNGKIILVDKDISNTPMHQRSNLGIKYLPQEPSIFQNLSVYENLYGLAELSLDNKKDIQNFIDISMEEFNLSDISNLKGRQLSGGQRRKVEIARTLAAEPKIILITDHNVRETLEICTQAAIINNGEIIAQGDKQSLTTNDLVKKVYLGDMYN